jgi:hypothetical protein
LLQIPSDHEMVFVAATAELLWIDQIANKSTATSLGIR